MSNVKIDFEQIPRVQMDSLCRTLLAGIEKFYSVPENLHRYEDWLQRCEKAKSYTLSVESNPYVTFNICKTLYDTYKDTVYQPYTATKSCYDPAAELGDGIIIGDKVCSIICSALITLDIDFRSDVSAPNSNDLLHQYPFLSSTNKANKTSSQAVSLLSFAQPVSADYIDIGMLKTEVEKCKTEIAELKAQISKLKQIGE